MAKWFDKPADWRTTYQWRDLGYRVVDVPNQHDVMQLQSNFDDGPGVYNVYSPKAVVPTKSKQAAETRRRFQLDQVMAIVENHALIYAVEHPDFTEDDAWADSTDLTDRTYLDVFGDRIMLDDTNLEFMQQNFVTWANKYRNQVKAIRAASVTQPEGYLPPGTIPGNLKTDREWSYCGYRPRDPGRIGGLWTTDHDGKGVKLFTLDECVPIKDKHDRRIRYHLQESADAQGQADHPETGSVRGVVGLRRKRGTRLHLCRHRA